MSRRHAALAVLSVILVAGLGPATPRQANHSLIGSGHSLEIQANHSLAGVPLGRVVSRSDAPSSATAASEPRGGGTPPRTAGEPIAAPSGASANPVLTSTELAAGGRQGTWAYANASHGPSYLAIPEGRGWIVEVCGPLGCRERVSTDAGPELYLQRAGRIGDLSSVDFRALCGPLSAGLCRGSYTILGVVDQSGEDGPRNPADDRMRQEDGGPVPTLPATSVANDAE